MGLYFAAMAHFNPPAPGSVAIVTGASAGLGRAFALALARRGHTVLAIARRAERLAELVGEAPGPGRIEPLALDVTADGAATKIHEAARKLGEIGWLVNNAGGSTFGRFEDSDVAAERALVRLNCESVVALTGEVLPGLVARRRGIVLNVASSAGMQPTPGWSVYGASKAFVLAFSEGLYDELRGSGVSATALAPGPVATEFFSANAAGRNRRVPPWEVSAEACVEQALRAALAGRALLVVGLATRLLVFGSRFSPRALARWVSGRVGLRFIGLPPLPPRPSR
jgi:short-subunit dehydrogenase